MSNEVKMEKIKSHKDNTFGKDVGSVVGVGVGDWFIMPWWTRTKNEFYRMFFGVLYSMMSNNGIAFGKLFLVANIIIEFVQLISFSFRQAFPWPLGLNYLGLSASFLRLPVDFFNYSLYKAVFWMVFILIWAAIGNAAFVAYGFKKERATYILPIRTLQWFVTVLVTVLFIPVVTILFVALTCDGPVLRSFPEVQCWGPAVVSLDVAALLSLIPFVFFVFANGATYYECDPTTKVVYSMPHPRFDLLLLLIKTIWTILFEFLAEVPVALSIVLFLGAVTTLVSSLILMPYYLHRLNKARSGLFAVITWTTFMLMVVVGVNDTSNGATAAVFFIGIIPAFFGGWFAHEKRYQSLQKLSTTNPNNRKQSSANLVLKWDSNIDSATHQHISKGLRFPTDAEIATRFVYHNASAEAVQRAEIVYEVALEKFPKSMLVKMAYINFLTVVKRDKAKAMHHLTALRKQNPPFDVNFFIYRQDREREKEMQADSMGENFGDFIGWMEFKKTYGEAHDTHVDTLRQIRKFWQILLDENPDLAKVSTQAGRIAQGSEKADNLFRNLLTRFPRSTRIIREYAQFIDDVFQDEPLVKVLLEKADELEELEAKAKSSLRDSDEEAGDARSDGAGTEDVKSASKSMTVSSRDDITTVSSLARRKMVYSKHGSSGSVRLLSRSLIGTSVLSILIAISIFAVISGRLTQYSRSLTRVKSAGGLGTLGLSVSIDSLGLYKSVGDILEGGLSPEDYNYTHDYVINTQHKLIQNGISISNIIQALAWGETPALAQYSPLHFKAASGIDGLDITTRVFSYTEYDHSDVPTDAAVLDLLYGGNDVEISVRSKQNNTYKVDKFSYGLWRSTLMLAESARSLAALDFPSEKGDVASVFNSTQSNALFWYIVDNAPHSILTGLNKLHALFTVVGITRLTGILVFAHIIYGIIGFFFIMLGVLIFRPVVNRVVQNKIKTLSLFLIIPNELIEKMATRKIKTLKREDKIKPTIDHIEDGIRRTATPRRGSLKDTDRLLHESLRGGSRSGGIEKSSTNNYNNKKKTASDIQTQALTQGFRKTHGSYICALFCIIFVFSILYIIAYLVLVGLQSASTDMLMCDQRTTTLLEIKMHVTELVYNKHGPFQGSETLQDSQTIRAQLDASTRRLLALEGHFIASSTYKSTRSDVLRMMYNPGCLRLNVSNCLQQGDEFYDAVSQGLGVLMDNFFMTVYRLRTAEENSLDAHNYDFRFFTEVVNNDLYDAFDMSTAVALAQWYELIAWCNMILGASAGAVAGFFIILQFTFFRKLVNKLDMENTHTLAMLQMIPKDELQNISELRELTQL